MPVCMLYTATHHCRITWATRYMPANHIENFERIHYWMIIWNKEWRFYLINLDDRRSQNLENLESILQYWMMHHINQKMTALFNQGQYALLWFVSTLYQQSWPIGLWCNTTKTQNKGILNCKILSPCIGTYDLVLGWDLLELMILYWHHHVT